MTGKRHTRRSASRCWASPVRGHGSRVEASASTAKTRSLVFLLKGNLGAAFDKAVGAVGLDPSGMNTPLAAREAARAPVWSRDILKTSQALEAMAGLCGRLRPRHDARASGHAPLGVVHKVTRAMSPFSPQGPGSR